MSDVEKLTASQREMLKAIIAGETQLSSEGAREKYRLLLKYQTLSSVRGSQRSIWHNETPVGYLISRLCRIVW